MMEKLNETFKQETWEYIEIPIDFLDVLDVLVENHINEVN